MDKINIEFITKISIVIGFLIAFILTILSVYIESKHKWSKKQKSVINSNRDIKISSLIYIVSMLVLLKITVNTSFDFVLIIRIVWFVFGLKVTHFIVSRISSFVINKRKIFLKEKGILIKGNDIAVISNKRRRLSLGKRNEYSFNQYYISCAIINPITGEKMYVDSEEIWYNPEIYIKKNNITEVDVYFDRKNSKRYFVDIGIIEYESEKIFKR